MRRGVLDQRAQGMAVLERFAGVSVTGDLAVALQSFALAHETLEVAAVGAAEARRARDAALAGIRAADGLLHQEVERLANKLVAAELGPRKNPFARFSKLTPAGLTSIGYLREVSAVRALAEAVAAASPPAEVARALGGCLQRATAIEQSVRALSGPQTTFDLKRAARDRAAKDWERSYGRLRRRAEVAFEDEPATLKALFAPVERVQRPVARRKRSKGAKPLAPASE